MILRKTVACILGMHGLFPCLPLLSRQCNINITYLTILLKMCVCVFVCLHDFMCIMYVQVPTEARESPGAEEVTDNCELSDMVVEN